MAQFSAIAEGIHSMDSINHLRVHAKKLRFLNLHGNGIRAIYNLEECYYLEELDLSSNKITIISGLEACESLLKLNLSCNDIKLATSLDFLYKLKHLNLSYNKLSQVKTLSHFAEKQFQLEELFLHGNKLSSVPATIGAIRKILTLKHLTLHSNPLCQKANYRKAFGECMPQIETIDDFPRSDDSFSESVSTYSSVTTQPIDTPHIDKAIKYHRHERSFQDTSVGNSSMDSKKSSKDESSIHQDENLNKPAQSDPTDKDYTNLIKQVLIAMREEEQPVKLQEEHQTEPPVEPSDTVIEKTPEKAQPSADAINLESLKSTNKLLLAELESERERRWKSEKHIAELSDKVVKNEHAIQEYESLNKSSEAGINGIRDLLMKEQNQKMKLANLLESFKEKHKEVVELARERESHLKKRDEEIAGLHKTADALKSSSEDAKKQYALSLQQTRQEAQVQRRESELLRHQLRDSQVEVRSLQELIVTREQEHVREKENLVPLNGTEFNKRVEELVENERQKHELMNKNLIDSAKSWQQKHMELEKEFRMALYLENKRYEELHASFCKVFGDLSTHRTALSRLKTEDAKKMGLIEKLKMSVSEQSVAIDKLRKSRSDLEEKCNLRIGCLEKELEKSTKSVVELTAFHKENEALKAENSALQSVIEGLRAERNLWSKELAEQGAQLALDRGSLQSELGALKKELAEKEDKLQSVTDATRIKEHQFNDAMDTIKKLKQTITYQEDDLKEVIKLQAQVDKISREKEDAESRVEALREALSHCQEERENVHLKIQDLSEENDVMRKKYKDLKQQWESKVSVVEKVEKATQEMVERHVDQEERWKKKIEMEQEKIMLLEKEIRDINQKHLLDVKKQEEEAEKKVKEVRDKEESYKAQISSLEQEMRLILHQTEQMKRDNDAKLAKLAGALGEFTTLLKPK